MLIISKKCYFSKRVGKKINYNGLLEKRLLNPPLHLNMSLL